MLCPELSDADIPHWTTVQKHILDSLKLTLRASLIGFLHFPGTHTGERLAEAFSFVIGRTGLERKVMSTFSLTI